MAFLHEMSNIIHRRFFCLLADDHGSGFFLFRRVLFILTRLCRHGTEGTAKENLTLYAHKDLRDVTGGTYDDSAGE